MVSLIWCNIPIYACTSIFKFYFVSVHKCYVRVPAIWYKYFVPWRKHWILSWVIRGYKCPCNEVTIVFWRAKGSSRSIEARVICSTWSSCLQLYNPVLRIRPTTQVKYSLWTIWNEQWSILHSAEQNTKNLETDVKKIWRFQSKSGDFQSKSGDFQSKSGDWSTRRQNQVNTCPN